VKERWVLIDWLLQNGGAKFTGMEIMDQCGNDPSAGSPTETLLRLHLPLNDKV
jgi:hypothetical protein